MELRRVARGITNSNRINRLYGNTSKLVKHYQFDGLHYIFVSMIRNYIGCLLWLQ